MPTATHICQVCDRVYEIEAKPGNYIQVKKIGPCCRDTHRWCSDCRRAKLLSDFHDYSDGRKQHRCRPCHSRKMGSTRVWECAHCHGEYLTTRTRRYNGQNDWYCEHCIGEFKRCKRCDTIKPVDRFYRRSDSVCGRSAHCIDCLKVKTDAAAESLKLKQYDLTVEQYREMFDEQGGCCYLCKRPESNVDRRTGRPIALAVDHCHVGGHVRRLLCQRCNQALGLLRDDAKLMRAAADYIEHFTPLS